MGNAERPLAGLNVWGLVSDAISEAREMGPVEPFELDMVATRYTKAILNTLDN